MFNSMQEAFDKTIEIAAKQGKQCVSENNKCLYEHEGSNCFVGFHLPKGEHMELYGDVRELLEEFPKLYTNLDIKGETHEQIINFWVDIQRAHDHGVELQRIQYELTDVALSYKLNPDKISLIKKWNGPEETEA